MANDEAAQKSTADIEAKITQSMKNNLNDFKQQADSLTLEGVRRALEKDLGLNTYSLDAHKRFIKKCLEQYFYGANDEKNGSVSLETEASQSVKEHQTGDDQTPPETGKSKHDADKGQEEPLSSTGKEHACTVAEESKLAKPDGDLKEETVKEALKKRASYLRANAEHISLVKVRRILEEDLKLELKALDAYKSLIAEEVDTILQSSDKRENVVQKKSEKSAQDLKKSKPVKQSKSSHKESDSSDINNESLSEDDNEDKKVRPKKRAAPKSKASERSKPVKQSKSTPKESDSSDINNESLSEDDDVDKKARSKKRAAPKSKASETSLKKQKKSSDQTSDSKKKKADGESTDGSDQSSDENDSSPPQEVKKKPVKPVEAHSKRVEHLRSVIKSCGMGIPPSVYRRAKQAPESKRDAFLIKELENILEKEGLSSNPSEKEIKEARKRKETAKELEGIDMSNIVTTSRRRSTSSYVPPPKPKIEVESDEEDDEEEEDDDDEDNGDNNGDSDNGDNNDEEMSAGSDEGAEDESD